MRHRPVVRLWQGVYPCWTSILRAVLHLQYRIFITHIALGPNSNRHIMIDLLLTPQKCYRNLVEPLRSSVLGLPCRILSWAVRGYLFTATLVPVSLIKCYEPSFVIWSYLPASFFHSSRPWRIKITRTDRTDMFKTGFSIRDLSSCALRTLITGFCCLGIAAMRRRVCLNTSNLR